MKMDFEIPDDMVQALIDRANDLDSELEWDEAKALAKDLFLGKDGRDTKSD